MKILQEKINTEPKKIKYLLKVILDKISNLIFPIQCALCKNDSKYLCLPCENNLQKNTNIKDKQIIKRTSVDLANKTFAKYNYKDERVRNLLFKLKYNHHPKLGEVLGEYSRDFIFKNTLYNTGAAEGGTCIENKDKDFIFVPIPISEKRLKERGYNQAYHISVGISKENTFNILKRNKNTEKLKDSNTLDNRLSEVENSMGIDKNILSLALSKREGIKPTISNDFKNIKVILIDDITTTGATFYEAKRTLINYGFEKENIYAFALAH